MYNMDMYSMYTIRRQYTYLYSVHKNFKIGCYIHIQQEGEDNATEEGGDKSLSTKDLDPNNPREYIQKASASMDDEYSQKKGSMQNYYGIAHTFREVVEDQPTIMVNGRLKEYQVHIIVNSICFK